MQAYVYPALLLTLSNTFMTFAWYGHLLYGDKLALWIVVLLSWGIAFFEYCFMVPANRLGHDSGITTGQLKVMQEAITLVVFAIFSWGFLREKLTWNYYVAFGFILAAVFMVFYFNPAGAAKEPVAPLAQVQEKAPADASTK